MKAGRKAEEERADTAVEATCFGCVVAAVVLLLFGAVVALAFSRYGFGIVF